MNGINLLACRSTITLLIKDAVVDERVLACLRCGNGFIPKECELWDYKEIIENDALSLAKTVKHIVAMHNSYGGYIIYGVKEIRDNAEFVAVGIDANLPNSEQLRSLIKQYTGHKIDVTILTSNLHIGENGFSFGIMHIPKRSCKDSPIDFVKDGPQDEKGKKNLFIKKDCYFRSSDQSVAARDKEDWMFLQSERINPLASDSSLPNLAIASSTILPHNLPDSRFICPHFVGRENIIRELWVWLADEFSRTRLLAGEGGKGKTSIAYEFACEVCRTRPCNLEQVVWLTGKKVQFRAIKNEYVSMPETHFVDADSLVRRLCLELAAKTEEVDNLDANRLRGLLRRHLEIIPSLVILDDLDSLSVDEQKKVMEIALQTGATPSRFLLTSRMNFFSLEAAINIPGFAKHEFIPFVHALQERLEVDKLNNHDVEVLLRISEGSPLFAESIFRLIKSGMKFDRAIAQWKDKMGDDVRRAALLREIKHLTQESRRVLYTAALLGSASVTELRQANALSEDQVTHSIEELRTLFLISAPLITQSEPRFAISSSTSRLILDNAKELIPDPKALELKVRHILDGEYGRPNSKRSGNASVGEAVQQALALISTHNFKDAIATADAALKQKKDNADLLLLKGRCLFDEGRLTSNTNCTRDSRIWFRRAYESGSRKDLLYSLWYDSEMCASNPSGANDVATFAIQDRIQPRKDWLMRLTESAWSLSRSHSRSMNPRAALDELKRVIGSLRDVLRFSSKHEHPATLELMGLAINEAWTIADKIASRPADYIEAYEIAKAGVSAGLCGDLIFGMMIKSTGGLLKSYGIRDALTPIQIDSVIQRISQIKLLVKTVNPPLCSQHADALDLGLRKITNQIKPPTE